MDTTPNTNSGFEKPFRASWIDHLIVLIERLPGPAWVAYLISFIFFAIFNNVVLWIVGFSQPGAFHPLLTFSAVYVIYGIGFYHYLNEVARRSLHDIFPLLERAGKNEKELEYRMTYLPFKLGWLSIIVGTLFGVFDAMSSQAQMQINSVVVWMYSSIFSAFSYSTLFALIFRTARQLSIVVHLHHRVAEVDLFNLTPLRAFARLTAVAGFSIFFLGALSAFVYMEDSDASLFILYFAIVIAGILVFIIPLLSLRTRINKEKKQSITEINQRIKRTLHDVKQSIQQGDLTKMGEFHTTLNVLEKEKGIMKGISSLPWNPNTLKSFVTTIFIPILIWLIRTVLEKWL